MEQDNLELLLADIRKLQKRATEARALESKNEFMVNCYPMMEQMVEAFQERFEEFQERVLDVEAVIAEQIEQTESVLQPELTTRVLAVLGVGERLAAMVEVLFGAFGNQLDELTAKRLMELTNGQGSPSDWANAYRADAQLVAQELDEATLEDVEDEDDDTTDDAEEETDEGVEE